MIAHYRYRAPSAIVNGLDRARLAFATNTLRDEVAFHGTLTRPLLFREALAALYHVVVSDLKYRPRDRLAFKAWLEEQDRKFLADLAVKNAKARKKIEEFEARLGELNDARAKRMAPFHKARLEFFNYVYENEYELSYLFDPVITVHPDEVSFEAFSRDESTYARLAARFDLFKDFGEPRFGTTNIDFSATLHNELERMRSYRRTAFDIDPGGFEVMTEGTAGHKEKKIDLPESWVKGFLQVHSTMTMGLTRITVAPVDLFNICRYLRRRKAKASPRSMRYELTPGQRGKVVLEPWNHEIELTGMEPYEGPKPVVFRTWGRQRLLTLARLIPVAQRIDVYLAGQGLPSIYVLDLGEITFTLALSGWTDNDWTGGEAKFDLLTRRLMVKAPELFTTLDVLKNRRYSTDQGLAAATGLGVEKVRSALSYLCQVGRAMVDLGGGGVYRYRDLFGTPLSVKDVEQATSVATEASTPQEKAARELFNRGDVLLIARRPVSTGYKLSGSAKGDGGRVRPMLHCDHEGRIIEASCTCGYYKKYQMTKGPCEHVLALRLAHMSRLEHEDSGDV